MYNFVKGNRLFVKGSREDDDPDNIADPNENQLINDHSHEKHHYDFQTKNHLASASQESREIFRTSHNRNGLKTIHTQKVARKLTTVNRGEQRKLPTYSMLEGNKLKEKLMKWAQKTTRGYPGVNITDFTNSWRDGLAYNAIIHRNRPDLIDYLKCRDRSDKENLQTAFNTLSHNFGINHTLTPEEIVRSEPSEDEMIKYLEALYELFPDPPDHNPLWDAEKIRRIDEYKDLASRLLVWLRESIPKLNDRNFPNTVPEMLNVKRENDIFKTEQIPPKLHDKQKLASTYEDVLNMARSLPGKHVKIEDEYDISNIERLWKNMITAHQKREHDINEEIARLEKLEKIAENLVKEIDICDHNLESIKKQIIEEEKQVLKQDPLKPNFNIDNIQRSLAEEEGRIKNMYNVVKFLTENKYHHADQLANQVDYLYKKWKQLKLNFDNNVVKVLNERKEAALRKPKTEEELINENEHFRFLHECIQKVLEKRKYLESLSLGDDVHSIQRRLEQFKEEEREIKLFQSKVDECNNRKIHIKPQEMPIYNNMLNRLHTAYDDLKSFTRQRITDLSSLLEFFKAAEKELAWIASKEEIEVARDWSSRNVNIEQLSKYHYSLVKEMESREREFNRVQDRGESLIRERHPGTKLIENMMAKMQYNWSWLLQLINCFEQHLKHTGDFINFMDDVNESKKLINSFEDKLNNQYSRQHITIEEGEKMLKEMLSLKDDISKIGTKINDLESRSSHIVNMKQRKLPLPHPIKVKSLCMIKNENAIINKNEMVTLYDNSQRTKWRINTSNNTELNIPSVCFVIPPPDPDVIDALAELKNKLDALIALWAQKHRELRQNMVLASLKLVKDWDYPTYCAMDPRKRDNILRMLEDDINKLAREGPPDDPKIRHLQDELDDIKKKFAEFEERRRREEEEKKNQAMIQKFIDSANDLLEKLQEKERILIQRAQNSIPREMSVLENLIVEHNEFEHDLSKYESRIRNLKEEFFKISNKSHAAQSKYEAIIETWDRVCNLSKHYAERLKALQTVLVDIQQAVLTLNEVQTRLVQQEEIPADEIDLNRMFNELKELQNTMQTNNGAYEQLLSNVTKVRRLVERTRPKQTSHADLNRLEEDVKLLYKKWKNASTSIMERLSAIELCSDLLKKYRTLMNVEKNWLNQTSAKVQTMMNRSDLDYVTRIYESLVERKPAIEETTNAGYRFIQEAKSSMQKIKSYKESLEDHAEISAKRLRKHGGVEIVEQELEALNNEYKSLLDQVLSYLNQLQDDESRIKEFNSIASKLKYWLEQKEKLIAVLGPIGSEPYVVQSQLRQINVMKDEFSSQEHLLNKMDKLGNSILERIDRTNPYYTEVSSQMNDIHKTWKHLLAILDEREKNLMLVSEASADFQNKLAKLTKNLDAISDEFDKIVHSNLENDEQLLKLTNLEDNLEGQRPLLAELGNSCNNLCNLLTDNASKNECREKFKNVENRYNDLSRKISNKKTELQSTIKEDREFFMLCDELQDWLRNMLNLLSKEIKISAIYEIVQRQIQEFEPIYQQVRDKEHEVHMVINKGNALLNKSYKSDTSNWRQKLDNIKRQWDLVKKEALEKKSKLHKCLDICREFNANYNSLYPVLEQYEAKLRDFQDIPINRSELENRLKEIQFLKSDISKRQRDFDQIRNLADQLLSIADTDKDHVKDRMNQLKELWDRVNNEILKKNQLFDSVLQKLILYKESLKDFNNALQRIEDKMVTHQSFSDQKLVERMRSLLDEAKDLRHNLDALKNHAHNLINEIRNEKATRQIEKEVEAAENRYNDLLNKLEVKCKDLDALANDVKNFTMKLSDIQNELNQMEKQLNNMGPIARNPDVLRNQLDEIKDFRSNLEKVHKKLKDAEQIYKNILDQDHTFDNNMYRYQLDNLNRQYDRLDDLSNQRMNNILKMLDKVKAFYDDYKDVDKNLNDVSREIDNLKPISRDIDAIRAQQNEFRNLNANVIEPLARKVDDLIRKANALIQSALPGVDTSKLEQDADKINSKWNNLKEKINDRERKLDSAMLQAGRFQDALDAFEKWLNDTENMLANQKPPSSDHKVLKSQIQEQQLIKKMINDRESSLHSLKELGQEFMRNLDSNEKFHVENQLNDLTKRFNVLKNECDKRLNLLKEIYPIAKAFSDKALPLQEWLDNTERKLNNLKQSMAMDSENLRNKIKEHQILHQDVLNHKPDFERLTEIAQNLISLLTDDEAQIVVDKYKELTDRYARLVEDSLEFGEELDEAKKILDNFNMGFDDLFNWIDKMENRVNKHKYCAVSVEKIRDQLDDLRDINQEIQSTEPKIYEILNMYQNFNRGDSITIKQKIDQLQFRFNELKRKALDYQKNLKDALGIAQNFYNAHEKVNAWMDVAEKSLKSLDSQSIKQQESTIRTLENQINENKSLIDIINNLAPQFCNYTNGQGTSHVESIVIKDNRRFNNICDQINRQVDKIDVLKQRNDEVVNDIDELYDWFKDVERQLLEAEGIPHEPKKLTILLKETKALYDDINGQKGRVRDVLANVKKLVRNNNTEDMIHIREKSEELKDLANRVSQLCSDRLSLLEQALPLAEYFFEAYQELNQWLDEAENEAQRLGGSINAIRIKQQQEIINNLYRSINEHKPVLEKLNKTGQSLINIVQESSAKQLKRLMDDINERFNNLKVKLKDQQLILDSALQETSQFSGKIDGLLRTLQDLLDQLKNAEPISAHPPKIQEQIHENDSIIDELSKRKMAYDTICQVAQDLINKAGKTDDSIRDIYNQNNKLKDCWNQCNDLANRRRNDLNDAFKIATKFWEQLEDALKSLKKIEKAITAEESPACEPNAVFKQQEFLKEIKKDLDETRQKVDDCKMTGRNLIKIVGESDKYEIKKNIDDLENYWNNVADLFSQREKDLKSAMEKAMKFHEALQNLLEFLDNAEDTFANMGPIAADLNAVKKQLHDLNGFKKHVDSHLPELENFNRLANQLLECVSSSQAKSIREPMNEVNHRWDDLIKAIANRQSELENALLKLGQFEQSYNDFLDWLNKTERVLDEIKPTFNDPQVLEIELSKFKVLENDIYAHQNTVDTLNSAGKMLIDNERGTDNARATQNKLNHLNSRWQQLLDKTEQRKRELEELLKEAHSFNQELLDMISWINDMDNEISVSKPVGGLPETAREQLARFMEIYQEIESNRFRVDSLLDKGNELLKKSREAPTIQHNMKSLKTKWDNLLAKANDKKIKLEIALAEAIDFHNSLEKFVEWLTEAEKYLNNLQPVSKVLERITKQIEEHKNFQKDLGEKREMMMELDKKGTHLKYFSQKQDVILIKNLLVSVQHRWEKVLARASERSRNLDYGLRETKEFYDAWNDLMNWLNEMEKNFDSMQPISNDSEAIRILIQKHREFQRQLGAKHAQYDNTIKMGKNLKDKAPKIDVPILQNMIDELKNKWNSICNKSVDRQRKLEEALLFSGQFKDAIDALLDWLDKAREQLLSTQSVYGDLDTVTALVEQHKIFLEEFKRREKNLKSVHRISSELLKSSSGEDDYNIQAEIAQIDEKWKEVEQLSKERSVELDKAIIEAEKLHKSVNILLEWLSDAEMKLRFSGPMPEDEDATREQIAEHETFLEEMAIQEKSKDDTVKIAQDILEKCHPEAITVIKHWITIIQSRWEEVNSWSKQREQRLHDHLDSLMNIMDSLEKALAWLIGTEAALLAAETQPLPDDNVELNRLIDEHDRFMEDLEQKGLDVDKIAKTFAIKKHSALTGTKTMDRQSRRGYLRSSTPIKVQHDFDYDVKQPKVKELLDKWGKVNKLSNDRKKRLQDKLDYNNEVERIKHFDFDEWRRRFLGWMNNKKARIIDFFKRIDSNNDGRVTKSEFVEGFVRSKFTTSRLEMEKVAEIFDRNNDGYVDHKEYIDTLRPERDIPKTESEIIQDEVQKQVDKCNCLDKYKVSQVGECKYRFGESQKLRLVRILRSTVMVRVGGGWISLDDFLKKYDPCRAKGRTNIELREQLANDFDKSKSLYNDDGSVLSIGPITKIKEKTDRSLPMNSLNQTSDYSFSDHHDSSGTKSRPRTANSRHSSQPPSRTGSDLSIDSLDNSNPKLSTYKFTPKSLANKKIDSRQGSYTNIR
ncbi:cathepsin O-like cysteine peptidase protein [Sarcoptes scabiei]|nr:cathepsin O-like cysteine peptidase protein [Sarcoptes scabiei]